MATDDISVRVGRLEIESSKVNRNNHKEDNPFVGSIVKKNSISKIVPQHKCLCQIQKKKNVICRRKPNRILKEPVLKLTHFYSRNNRNECPQVLIQGTFSISSSHNRRESVCLHSLVDTCNQLHISSDNIKSDTTTDLNDNNKWWKNEMLQEKQNRESIPERNASSTCSQQALNPPCDVTIDELASYFETLVHIPKKMSSMAEMMYI